jgi:hypothetical protein
MDKENRLQGDIPRRLGLLVCPSLENPFGWLLELKLAFGRCPRSCRRIWTVTSSSEFAQGISPSLTVTASDDIIAIEKSFLKTETVFPRLSTGHSMAQAQEPKLVAYDYSGSTEGCAFYHDTVRRVLFQYEPYSVVLWDNRLQVSTPKQLAGINRTRHGRGGTRPILVAQHCIENQVRGHLILITDGQILPRHVEALDTYLESNQMQIATWIAT